MKTDLSPVDMEIWQDLHLVTRKVRVNNQRLHTPFERTKQTQ